jgi:DNA-directed RNA polymerase subunit RPC12/RpoP
MKWNNLKENKCPQCGEPFDPHRVYTATQLIICKCGFRISFKRFREIINSQVTKRIDEEEHYRPEDENPE